MAKVCPKCHATQPDGIAFCPQDGSTLVSPEPPQAERHMPTLVGVGAGQLQQLTAALQDRETGVEDATQAFDLSALQRPAVVPKPGVPPPPQKTIPPMQRPVTSQLKPVPAPIRPASAAVPAPRPAAPQPVEPASAPPPPTPPLTTLAKLIETSGALPTNLAVGRVSDLAELLARARPTAPITPAHVAYGDATGNGKPRWTERGALDPGYLAQYRPPDLADGATPATDVYILGCVLFEALTGKAPFRGKSVEEIAKKQAIAAAPAVRQIKLDCDVPPALEIELQRALKKRPGDRHPSVAAFAEAIRNAVREDDRSTTALDVSEAAYLQQLLQGGAPPAQVAAPPAAQIAAAPPARVAAPPPAKIAAPPPPAKVAVAPVSAPRPEPAAAPPPNRTGLMVGLVVAGVAVIGVGAFLALRNGTPPAPVPAPPPAVQPPTPPPEVPDVVQTPDVPPAPDIQPDVPPDVPAAPDIAPDIEKPKAKQLVHKPDVKPDVKVPDVKPPEKKPDVNRPPVF